MSTNWAENSATTMLMSRDAALEAAASLRALGARDPEGLVQLAADLASYQNRTTAAMVELIKDAYGDVARTSKDQR